MSEEKDSSKGKSSGLNSLLPLIVALVAMPILAFAMTKFMILPQIQKSISSDGSQEGSEHAESTDEEASAEGEGHGSGEADGKKLSGSINMYTMDKVLVNVKNSGGGRYLVVSFAIAGEHPNLERIIQRREPIIRDTVLGILMDFDIEDLGQPDIKSRVKVMMIHAFNNALGSEIVDNVYITEWAIQ